MDRYRPLPVHRSEAVGSGVAAADDHHVLALGRDGARRDRVLGPHRPVGERQEIHGLMDACQLPAGDRQVPGHRGAGRHDDGVVAGAQFGGRDGRRPGGRSHRHAGHENRALRFHLVQPALQVALLHLELGDAVAQQPAGLVVPLVDGDVVAGPGELLGRGQPGRTRPDDGDPAAGACGSGGTGFTHSSSQARSMIETSTCLIVTGSELMPSTHAASQGAGHRRPVNSGKLLVACRRLDRRLPLVPEDQVVPVGDDVAERAAVVAERDAAVHAPAGLGAEPVGLERLVDLPPVPQPDRDGPARRELAGGTRGSRWAYPWAAAMIASSTGVPAASARRTASRTRL